MLDLWGGLQWKLLQQAHTLVWKRNTRCLHKILAQVIPARWHFWFLLSAIVLSMITAAPRFACLRAVSTKDYLLDRGPQTDCVPRAAHALIVHAETFAACCAPPTVFALNLLPFLDSSRARFFCNIRHCYTASRE
jgi:hypothetical protein